MQKVLRFSLLITLFLGFLNVNSYAQLPSEYQKDSATQQTHIDQLYVEAEKAMQRKEWDTALRKLQLLNIRYPNNCYVEQAKLSIVYCYQQKREYQRALALTNEFIRDHSRSQWLESALQMKSEIENKNNSSNTNWILLFCDTLLLIISIKVLFEAFSH